MRDEHVLSAADVIYIRQNFATIEEVCAGRPETPDWVRSAIVNGLLPGPSYVLADGTEMVPPDYFALADAAGGVAHLREYFAARCPHDVLDEIWQGYLSGVYGVCLVNASPKNILRKGELMDEIEALLAAPEPQAPTWTKRLRAAVDALDALERPFSPDFDRVAFGRPPSRDRLVEEPRRTFAHVFDA